MAHFPILCCLVLFISLNNAFICPQKLTRGTKIFSSEDRQQEIARLEEQLRTLKEESASEGDSLTEEEQKYVADEKVLEKVQGKDMLLTEQELVDAELLKNEENDGGGLLPILAAVGLAAFLFFFSQVPVGQEDLARYQPTGSSTSKTIDLGDMNPDRSALNKQE